MLPGSRRDFLWLLALSLLVLLLSTGGGEAQPSWKKTKGLVCGQEVEHMFKHETNGTVYCCKEDGDHVEKKCDNLEECERECEAEIECVKLIKKIKTKRNICQSKGMFQMAMHPPKVDVGNGPCEDQRDCFQTVKCTGLCTINETNYFRCCGCIGFGGCPTCTQCNPCDICDLPRPKPIRYRRYRRRNPEQRKPQITNPFWCRWACQGRQRLWTWNGRSNTCMCYNRARRTSQNRRWWLGDTINANTPRVGITELLATSGETAAATTTAASATEN